MLGELEHALHHGRPRRFFGWWIAAAGFVTSGLAVGVPYYNVPFFYDSFQRASGWSRAQITLGFPLAAVLTFSAEMSRRLGVNPIADNFY